MPLTVRIDVTQKDIDGGCMRDTRNCPVARAGSRALGTKIYVSEQGLDVRPVQMDEDGRVRLPLAVTRWIKFYDSSLLFEDNPFSFEVEIPDSVLAELPHLLLPLAVKEETPVCVS
jgi:hypothetical protein